MTQGELTQIFGAVWTPEEPLNFVQPLVQDAAGDAHTHDGRNRGAAARGARLCNHQGRA